jgi:hypothetical protein
MKRKVGKELEGGIEKRNEVRNYTPLASMFARQQVVNHFKQSKPEKQTMHSFEREKKWG